MEYGRPLERYEDTYYETHFPNVWLSHRKWKGGERWRLVEAEDVLNGAFVLTTDIRTVGRIVDWLHAKNTECVLKDIAKEHGMCPQGHCEGSPRVRSLLV